MRLGAALCLTFSLGVHVFAAVAVSRRAPAAVPPRAPELDVIELVTLGVANGEGSRATGRSADARVARRSDSRARSEPETSDPDGTRPAKRRTRKDKLDPARDLATPESNDKDAERERLRDAVRKSMLSGDPTDGRRGDPSGTPAGAGMGSYRGVLSGWFNARVASGGGSSTEPHELLRVLATITITPERRVVSFSLKSSGNPAYDARISSKLAGIVASGAVLPAPPDGEDVPPQVRLAFTCRPNERCF